MATQEEINERMAKARAARKTETKEPSNYSWKPAKKLDVPADLKDPRYDYYFVNKNEQGNESRMLQEGWEYDDEIYAKMQERGLVPARRAMNDGSPLDSRYTIRELVLMRMPKEMAEARRKYYRDRGNRARNGFKEAFQSQNPDVATYGESKEEREFRKI